MPKKRDVPRYKGYQVKPGDSWYRIAGEVYGNQRMAGELRRANFATHPAGDGLQPGQRIELPRAADNPYIAAPNRLDIPYGSPPQYQSMDPGGVNKNIRRKAKQTWERETNRRARRRRGAYQGPATGDGTRRRVRAGERPAISSRYLGDAVRISNPATGDG